MRFTSQLYIRVRVQPKYYTRLNFKLSRILPICFYVSPTSSLLPTPNLPISCFHLCLGFPVFYSLKFLLLKFFTQVPPLSYVLDVLLSSPNQCFSSMKLGVSCISNSLLCQCSSFSFLCYGFLQDFSHLIHFYSLHSIFLSLKQQVLQPNVRLRL